MNIGPAEVLVILVIALLVFGPKRLPEVGRQVGGALRELRKVQHTVRSEIDTAMREPTPTHPPRPDHGADDGPRLRVVEPDHDEGAPEPGGTGESDEGGTPAGPSGSFL